MKYYLIAGEASGDLHASNLMKAIKTKDTGAEFRFLGGDLMRDAGAGGVLVKHYREMAYMGVVQVLLHLRPILRNMRTCREDIRAYNPDVVILVDYPGFNLKIAKYVKTQLKIPVYYYISPKIWAWKKWRIKNIRRYIDEMFCILPFEVDFYNNNQYQVEYVGNPSVDSVAFRTHADETEEEFIRVNQLESKPIIALLAGSRKQEIKDNLPTMLRAAKKHSQQYQLVIAGAPGIDRDYYDHYLKDNPAHIVFEQTYRLLQQSKAALVTSGTATLETALFRIPQTVCYQTPIKHIVSFVFKNFFSVGYISLVNLIAGKTIVKELFAASFSQQAIEEELEQLLHSNEYRGKMLAGYDEVIRRLGKPGASEKAAQKILEKLKLQSEKN